MRIRKVTDVNVRERPVSEPVLVCDSRPLTQLLIRASECLAPSPPEKAQP